jgi:hypothetical protein
LAATFAAIIARYVTTTRILTGVRFVVVVISVLIVLIALLVLLIAKLGGGDRCPPAGLSSVVRDGL